MCVPHVSVCVYASVSTGKTARIQSQLYTRENIVKHANIKTNYLELPVIGLKIIVNTRNWSVGKIA